MPHRMGGATPDVQNADQPEQTLIFIRYAETPEDAEVTAWFCLSARGPATAGMVVSNGPA
jgi:hypothetical protein